MKILNARTGTLQSIPFTLGEGGRGRKLEEIKISNRPGQVPSGPEDVSYFVFGTGSDQHCILTASDKRRGILLRIDTRGVYTRGSCGRVSLVGGQATLLAAGQWAEGAAGNVASGPDQLWHIEGPALLEVVLQGGSHKGMGLRYLVVGRSMRPLLFKPDELVQLIATDADPEVTETVRPHAVAIGGASGAELLSALRLADSLETLEPSAESILHYSQGDLRAEVTRHNIAIPAVFSQALGGVSGVQAGTLVPGTQALVSLGIGPGGGKRYDYSVIAETGVCQLGELSFRPHTQKSMLYLVEDPGWVVAWVSRRDGREIQYTIANADGVHTHRHVWEDSVCTQEWPGIPAGPAPDFSVVFPTLKAPVLSVDAANCQPAEFACASAQTTPAQVSDLAAKFNRR